MADPVIPGSGAPGATGGAGGEGDKKGDPPNQTKETVSKEDHQRALDDMHRFKKKAADAEALLAAKETEDATKSGNYQKLYETEKTKVLDLGKQLKDVIGFNSDTHRLNEVKVAASAAGLRKEAVKDLELLDLSELPVELTSRNRYIVEGVGSFVESLKTTKPHWFQSSDAPRVNTGGGAPPPTPGKITPLEVAQAERDYKHGKIGKAEYEAKHNAYVLQGKTKS
jgi:hypothetical protein